MYELMQKGQIEGLRCRLPSGFLEVGSVRNVHPTVKVMVVGRPRLPRDPYAQPGDTALDTFVALYEVAFIGHVPPGRARRLFWDSQGEQRESSVDHCRVEFAAYPG